LKVFQYICRITSFTGALPSYFDKDIKNLIIENTGFDFTAFYLNKGILPSKPVISPAKDSEMYRVASQCMEKNLRAKSSSQDILKELSQKLDAIIKK